MINEKEILEIIIALYLIANFFFLVPICVEECFEIVDIFNPIKNYEEWTQFNWLGIIVITLILNVLFLPYAAIYWIYKLFTVGRKEE
jgi:hypothetical protein